MFDELFSSETIVANRGECVEIRGEGFRDDSADVLMFDQSSFKQFQSDYQSGSSEVKMKTVAQFSLSPTSPSSTVTIPRNGRWTFVFQPWRLAALTVFKSPTAKWL